MGDSTTTRPAPSASGTLGKTPFLHLLAYALEKQLTGSIEIFSPDKRSAAVLFVAGMPAKARTSEPVAYLGQVLLDLGHLTQEQLTSSLAELAKAKAQQPKLHGQLLLESSLIDAPRLKAGLREQLARKLKYAAGLPSESAYAYFDGFDALRGWGGEGDGIDPVPLFWGMLLEYAPWEHVGTALARVAHSPLRLASGKDLPRLSLRPEELAAAQLLSARPMRPAELAGAARLNERTAQLLAYLLLVTKQVTVLPSEAPATARATATQPPTANSSGPPLRSTGRPTPTPQSKVAPLTKPPSEKGGERTASGTTALPPPNLAPELAERWREITDRARTIDRADYFSMLDIARDATHAEVESAFFVLAKKWHPDRLPNELAPVRDACSRVFARMSEAHGTLADDEQRAKYMRLLADGSGSPEMQATVAKVVEAATNFQKAEVCLRRNDPVQAEVFCRKAVEDDATQPDYLAMLAWLLSLKREYQTPEKTVECIQQLERAITMNDRCEKAYFWRGMLFKKIGRNELAVRDFRRAAELNPRNIDAAREVRLYNMRGGGRRSSKPPPTGGIQRRTTPAPPRTSPPKTPAPRTSSPKPDDAAKGILGRLFKKS